MGNVEGTNHTAYFFHPRTTVHLESSSRSMIERNLEIMQFNFPTKNLKENIQVKLRLEYIEKVRALAKLNDCTAGDIYETLIEEAVDEYETEHGDIKGVKGQANYSHKRDLFKAGDNRRKEVTKEELRDELGVDPIVDDDWEEEDKPLSASTNKRIGRPTGYIAAKGLAYCQYASCPFKKEGPFKIAEMVQSGGLVFCTESCKAGFEMGKRDIS